MPKVTDVGCRMQDEHIIQMAENSMKAIAS